MPRRMQLMVPESEYDRVASHVYDGLRSRLIRILLTRACEAIENPDSNLTLDDIIRGEFKLEEHDHGNF